MKIFCQNIGGCGSAYIVALFKSNGCKDCYHEKSPSLYSEGLNWHINPNKKNKQSIIGKLKKTRESVFLESNNRLYSLTTLINESFPNCKFIHLHRDARNQVASILDSPLLNKKLKCHLNGKNRFYLLSGEEGESNLERVCHYWCNINDKIYNDLELISPNDKMSLKFEDLINGNTEELENFTKIKFNVKKINPVNNKKSKLCVVKPFDQWEKEEKEAFWKICENTMKKLNYI